MGTLVKGFLKRDGEKIVNQIGEEVILKGVGLGNWLLPEGYMWRFGNNVASPREIEALVADLIGNDNAKRFWGKFRENYITEADVKQMKRENWNSVRLPINSRFVIHENGEFDEAAFQLIDRFIGWCKKYNLYIILDLHGAPGGQTGTNIDDSPNNYPELFTSEKNQTQTINLWKYIANRYKEEWIIAGYDLLNEPLPNEFQYKYKDDLVILYQKIIAAIREVDNNHMIILEGTHWSTNWDIFDQEFDTNVLLQFHKYWSSPDTLGIQQYLDKRKELNVPIYMGEGGENNLDWYQAAFQLYDDKEISWNFWLWKKLDAKNSPCSINPPAGWDKVLAYIDGGEKPERGLANKIFEEFLDNILFENCTYQSDVVRSIMRNVPIRLQAEHFGYKGEGDSYGSTQEGNSLISEFRTDDTISIGFKSQPKTKLNFYYNSDKNQMADVDMYIQLHENEWVVYEINSNSAWIPNIKIRSYIESECSFDLCINEKLLYKYDLAKSKDWEEIRVIGDELITAGSSTIKLIVKKGTIKVDWLDVREVIIDKN